jgi:hypothetical protein
VREGFPQLGIHIRSESVKLMRKIRLGFVGLPGFVGTGVVGGIEVRPRPMNLMGGFSLANAPCPPFDIVTLLSTKVKCA